MAPEETFPLFFRSLELKEWEADSEHLISEKKNFSFSQKYQGYSQYSLCDRWKSVAIYGFTTKNEDNG